MGNLTTKIRSSINQRRTARSNIKFRRVVLFLLFFAAIALPSSVAYSEHVYQSLLKSRSALLRQRDDLRRSIDSTKSRIRSLNQKLYTLESYLYQTEKDLADVDAALKGG